MHTYYQPHEETMSRDEMRALQNEKFLKQVKHVYDNVPYYRQERWRKRGVTPEDIKSLDDIRLLPFLTKGRPARSLSLWPCLRPPRWSAASASSRRRARRASASSPSTRRETSTSGRNAVRAPSSPRAATNKDVVQVSYGYGLFTGGPGLNGGSHKVGCLTIPTSSGQHRPTESSSWSTCRRPSSAAPPPTPSTLPKSIEEKGLPRSDQAARGHLRRGGLDAGDAAGARKKARHQGV